MIYNFTESLCFRLPNWSFRTDSYAHHSSPVGRYNRVFSFLPYKDWRIKNSNLKK